ncbi:hypothetical protein QBC37DRAFT_135656 [Rhypophila decipiens]|uniref:EamA domain-containing protein n=1 Tax=Rhypophila decipiens TaxID=261697 RepID=A0AAN7BD00_9PEZI|nr:hypothetical protein QBC37DRAFT_135656 [Rhypophila decipiens]
MAIEPLMPMELGSLTAATSHTAPETTNTQQPRHHDQRHQRMQQKYDLALSSSPPDSPTTSPPRTRRSRSADRISVQLLARTSSQSSLGGTSSRSSSNAGLRAKLGLGGVARRTLGITLLLLTVFLWTLSNFLASYIFSNNTYSKPFFLVYVNTSIFALSLIPMIIKYVIQHGISGARSRLIELWRETRHSPVKTMDDTAEEDAERLLVDDEGSLETFDMPSKKEDKLNLRETAWLSLEFCALWFAANYFASACLEYTSVGSVTILTSTSSIWTLILCAITRVEGFTVRKLIGVLASLAGVVLISTVDLSGASDDTRGNFPHKTTAQIAIGDSMALFSALIYGVYVTVMKRRVGNEDRVDMPLFFGLVGLFNLVLFWPGFLILHFSGIEPFQLPPTGKIWTIIVVNSISSFFSDMFWAYAMLLTTPLVVTVGLSLTIPLSLIGEMIQYNQFSSWIYWVGAGIVFLSFVFVNHESKEEGGGGGGGNGEQQRGDTTM